MAKAALIVHVPRRSWLARVWGFWDETFQKTRGIPFITILVAATAWFLNATSQGKDMVVADQVGQRIWLCVMVLLFGVQAWFWSRMTILDNYPPDRELWRPKGLLVWGPRLLGVAPFVLLVPALLCSGDSDGWSVVWLVAVGLAFLVFLIKREDIRDGLAAGGPQRIREAMAERPDVFRRWWACLSFIIAAASFVVATFWPVATAQALGPAATVFLALASIIPVVTSLILFGHKQRLPVMGFALLAAAIFSMWAIADNHVVGRRAFALRPPMPIANRTNLNDAFETWIKQAPQVTEWKGDQPAAAKVTPMIFVVSEGGASRAGYWTAEALAALQDATHGQFSKSVFSITSVSGGSVGAVGFVASLDDRRKAQSGLRAALENYAGRDFLGPTMADMLLPDLVQRFLPVALLPDRGEIIERSWEAAWRGHCASEPAYCDDPEQLAKPFLSLWAHPGGWRPALIVEGASQENGRRILTSNLRLNPTPNLVGAVDGDDFYTITGHDVRASSAVLNGARFPWVSPAGTVVDRTGVAHGHIVDGGYFDGGGTEATRELAHAVFAGAKPEERAVLRPVFVVIGDCPHPDNGVTPTSRFADDLLTPVKAMFGSRVAHGDHLALNLRAEVASTAGASPDVCAEVVGGAFDNMPAQYVNIRLCETADYSVPLDWVLSKKARDVMHDAATLPSDTVAAPGAAKPAPQNSCAAGRNLDQLVAMLTNRPPEGWPRSP